MIQQRLDISGDRGKRRAQLMRDIRDKVALNALDLFNAGNVVQDCHRAAARHGRRRDLEDAARHQRRRSPFTQTAFVQRRTNALQNIRIADRLRPEHVPRGQRRSPSSPGKQPAACTDWSTGYAPPGRQRPQHPAYCRSSPPAHGGSPRHPQAVAAPAPRQPRSPVQSHQNRYTDSRSTPTDCSGNRSSRCAARLRYPAAPTASEARR